MDESEHDRTEVHVEQDEAVVDDSCGETEGGDELFARGVC